MQLFVKITPMRADSAEPVADPETMPCPPDVEPGTIRSFLVQRFGEPVEVAWTRTERHARVDIGWIFPSTPTTDAGEDTELLCVPLIDVGDGSLQPMFEHLADQRQEFEQLASSGSVDTFTVIEQPLREYRPTSGGAANSGEEH